MSRTERTLYVVKFEVLGAFSLQENTLGRKYHKEKSPGNMHPYGRMCLFLFYPGYQTHCLTHAQYSIYTQHSSTEERKGRREKEMRHIYPVLR